MRQTLFHCCQVDVSTRRKAGELDPGWKKWRWHPRFRVTEGLAGRPLSCRRRPDAAEAPAPAAPAAGVIEMRVLRQKPCKTTLRCASAESTFSAKGFGSAMADAAVAAPPPALKHSAARLPALATNAPGTSNSHQRVQCPFCTACMRRDAVDGHVESARSDHEAEYEQAQRSSLSAAALAYSQPLVGLLKRASDKRGAAEEADADAGAGAHAEPAPVLAEAPQSAAQLEAENAAMHAELVAARADIAALKRLLEEVPERVAEKLLQQQRAAAQVHVREALKAEVLAALGKELQPHSAAAARARECTPNALHAARERERTGTQLTSTHHLFARCATSFRSAGSPKATLRRPKAAAEGRRRRPPVAEPG